MKGGYKIIDFKNVSLSGTPVTMADVLVDLLNNHDKVVLLSHVVLSGSAKDDCYSTVLSDGNGGVKLNCYDGYISINSSGAVTYTVASASGMTENITGLQSDLADTDNMIAPAWSATAIYTKNSIVRDGGQLYKAKSDVPTGTVTSNTTYWKSTTDADELKNLNDIDGTAIKLGAVQGINTAELNDFITNYRFIFGVVSYYDTGTPAYGSTFIPTSQILNSSGVDAMNRIIYYGANVGRANFNLYTENNKQILAVKNIQETTFYVVIFGVK